MRKKPVKRVLTIRGDVSERDVVRQVELRGAADLQQFAWDAHTAASLAVKALQVRVKQGAAVEPGPLEITESMVRTRRKEGSV
jgi:hypothetical protein